MSRVSQLPADSPGVTDTLHRAPRRRPARRALIIFVAALLVSLLAAASMIGFAALTKSLSWAVVAAVLVAVLASWALGSSSGAGSGRRRCVALSSALLQSSAVRPCSA